MSIIIHIFEIENWAQMGNAMLSHLISSCLQADTCESQQCLTFLCCFPGTENMADLLKITTIRFWCSGYVCSSKLGVC